MSKGSAGVASSSFTTSVVAVVMRADLTCPGVQSSWAAYRSSAAPATCGDDIEVPAMAWKYSPGGPPAISSGVGVLPARIWTPGAVTSGLIPKPPGPRDEKAAITSPVASPGWPAVNDPVSPLWPSRNATSSVPSARWITGRKWLSVSTSASVGL